jgi:hypothetical protein
VTGKGTKLGERCPKVRLSQDRMPIIPKIIPKKNSGFLRSGLFHSGKVHGALFGFFGFFGPNLNVTDIITNVASDLGPVLAFLRSYLGKLECSPLYVLSNLA